MSELSKRLRAWAECGPNVLLEGAAADLDAAADALEAAEREAAKQHTILKEHMSAILGCVKKIGEWRQRAEKAEAERDDLRAKLAEAGTPFGYVQQIGNSWQFYKTDPREVHNNGKPVIKLYAEDAK